MQCFIQIISSSLCSCCCLLCPLIGCVYKLHIKSQYKNEILAQILFNLIYIHTLYNLLYNYRCFLFAIINKMIFPRMCMCSSVAHKHYILWLFLESHTYLRYNFRDALPLYLKCFIAYIYTGKILYQFCLLTCIIMWRFYAE